MAEPCRSSRDPPVPCHDRQHATRSDIQTFVKRAFTDATRERPHETRRSSGNAMGADRLMNDAYKGQRSRSLCRSTCRERISSLMAASSSIEYLVTFCISDVGMPTMLTTQFSCASTPSAHELDRFAVGELRLCVESSFRKHCDGWSVAATWH
jgi:hypothetical protein